MSVDLDRLFRSAGSSGGLDFIFTLTRVAGMSYESPDPLLAGRAARAAGIEPPGDARGELLKLLGNLLRCAAREPYSAFVQTDERALGNVARDAGYPAIAEALEAGGAGLEGLLGDLLDAYEVQRRGFVRSPRFHKLPDFTVLELLTDEDVGLTGFRAHFSNGEYAEFKRTDTAALPMNLSFDDGGSVVFFVGDLGALVNEWRIGGRPLYEIGLEGRYNAPGEWKPLVYPAEWDQLARRARVASDRPEVQGALLYIFLTGHHAVEFAARTTVELPHDAISFGGGRLELFKLSHPLGREVVYDGTVYVESPEVEQVEEALLDVQALVNRIAFAFDAAVAWVPKYSTVYGAGGHATPSDDDLQLLDHLLGAVGDPGRQVVDAAIDWYNRGRSAENEFVAFLCSYISFESAAVAVWSGDLAFPVALNRQTKPERRAETARCIQALHDLEYDDDPARFVQRAYFECVESLTRRVQTVARAVFGDGSTAVQLLFEKQDGSSLSDIRGWLAHGRLSLSDHEARELVRRRLPEIQDVARDFLLRLALRLNPTVDVPQWSRLHRLGITMDDPRATLCTTSLEHLPTSDWKIRPNWIE